MTRNESRWAQIVFWPIDDLYDLHRREIKREARCNALIADRKPPIELWDLSFMEMMMDRAGLQPYWDRMLSESDRKTRMDHFTRAIYPVWKPIIGQIEGADASEFADMAALHKADLAIFRKNLKPNRGNAERTPVRTSAPRDGND